MPECVEDVLRVSPVESISRARGLILSWASRRALCWRALISGERSKSTGREATWATIGHGQNRLGALVANWILQRRIYVYG